MIKEALQKLIREACANLGFEVGEIALEHPENPEHGDYSTNIALILGKQLSRDPKEIAGKIVEELLRGKLFWELIKIIEKLSFTPNQAIAGPGFINFSLKKEFFVQELQQILKQKEKYGIGREDKKIMVEFTDPNPFKEFHIGHLYSNIVGETLCKILEANGATVKRANYQGDVGMHVAKAIWGMQSEMTASHIDLQQLEKKNLKERIEFLGQSYAKGAVAFEENEEAKKEIAELNKKIFALDSSIKNLYQKGKKWSLEYFETIYKRLGTKFNFYYFESEVGKIGLKLVQENLKKGIFKESEGAVIFPGGKYGLHNRVFINSQGLPTYEAKELGLAPTKYKDFKYDLSIIVTGNEIIDYFKVLIAALKLINPKLGERTRHVAHGMVRLAQGKMSSRSGNVITAEELLDEVKVRVEKIMGSAGNKEVAEAVALGAVKYALLKVSLGNDIIFDFEKSLSLQGDSGPYIQYTYARCKSILRKSTRSSDRVPSRMTGQIPDISKEEMDILRTAYKFPEIVREAAENFSPNLVASFAFDLAQKYNLFYNTRRVLEAETKEQREFRLMLTAATAQIIKNSLSLLGVESPERM